MERPKSASAAVRTGDIQGRGDIYDRNGRLIAHPGETILHIAEGWDMTVTSPWRRLLPKIVFLGFNPKASSRLYVTSSRIVLIREIDAWRQLAGEMTPLGMPNAIAEGVWLNDLRAAGVRQFCEIRPGILRIARSRKSTKRGSLLAMFLEDLAGTRYAISFWKTDGSDDETLVLIESRFSSSS